MSTLDNLNENILYKIELIDKIINLLISQLLLPIDNININNNNTNDLPISFC